MMAMKAEEDSKITLHQPRQFGKSFSAQMALSAQMAEQVQHIKDSLVYAAGPKLADSLLTASDIEDMKRRMREDKPTLTATAHGLDPASMTTMWGQKLHEQVLKSSVFNDTVSAKEKYMPRVDAELMEARIPEVPADEDSFVVQVAVTAKLHDSGFFMQRIADQCVKMIMDKRRVTTMRARDILEVDVVYSDLGIAVSATTNATMSKVVVHVQDLHLAQEGEVLARGYPRITTYEELEAHQDAVPAAKGR